MTLHLHNLIHILQSPICRCQQPKSQGETLCDACYHRKYIEAKQPSEREKVACERLDQWEPK